MPRSLEAAYRRTQYAVPVPGGTLVLKVDAPSPALGALQARLRVACSGFITACNPRSEPRAAADNAAAQLLLRQRLRQRGYVAWHAEARDPQGRWPVEDSWFVPGLTREAALALGAEFAQNAVLHAGADAVPRLLWVTGPGSSAGSDPRAAPGTATSGS